MTDPASAIGSAVRLGRPPGVVISTGFTIGHDSLCIRGPPSGCALNIWSRQAGRVAGFRDERPLVVAVSVAAVAGAAARQLSRVQVVLRRQGSPMARRPVLYDRLDCWYGRGKGRGDNLDDQIAAVLQFGLHRCSLYLVADDSHAGFVGPSRVPV
jgi:hypothetical protein